MQCVCALIWLNSIDRLSYHRGCVLIERLSMKRGRESVCACWKELYRESEKRMCECNLILCEVSVFTELCSISMRKQKSRMWVCLFGRICFELQCGEDVIQCPSCVGERKRQRKKRERCESTEGVWMEEKLTDFDRQLIRIASEK